MTITKGERQELRGVVKQQFRLLKGEVRQREAELIAEVEARLDARYRQEDRRRSKVESRIAKIVIDAQAKIDAIVEENEKNFDEDARAYLHHTVLSMPRLAWDESDKAQFRRVLMAEVEAITRNAMSQLDRQEADLLRTLVLGAIDTPEAKAFLDGIPTVAELVPSSRLAELERSWSDEEKKELNG